MSDMLEAIVAIIRDAGRVLVIRRGPAARRSGYWAPLSGTIEAGESQEDAVVREVYEEASVRLGKVSYVSSQPWPFPASSMCGFYAEAVSRDCEVSDELEEVRWFTTEELAAAVKDRSVLLSPPVSIAFQLLADWFRKQGGGDLEALCRKYRHHR